MSEPEQWEDVASPRTGDYLERIRAPGGWLYRVVIDPSVAEGMPPKYPPSVSLCFVPDYRAARVRIST